MRAAEWETEDYWRARIRGYVSGTVNPGHALAPRVIYVAVDDARIVGFIAGHLSTRFGCDGELEWLNVAPDKRRGGIAGGLFRVLATWFADHHARRICVDADPENPGGRAFYRKHGAQDLNPHWLVWPDITEGLALNDRREWN